MNGDRQVNVLRYAAMSAAVLCGTADPVSAQYASQNAQLLSHIPLSGFTGNPANGNGCWGYVSPSGREYALMGLSNSVAVVEITNPGNPVIIGQITHSSGLWCEINVYGDNAYAVNESGGGMDIIDLSAVDNGVVTLVQRYTGNGLSTSHTVTVNPDSGYLYLNGSNLNDGRLVAFSLANPNAPVLAGQVDAIQGVYVHDSQVVTYTSGPYIGKEIAFCCNGPIGLDIYDVTDKSNMLRLSRSVYPNLSYCHQGWLSDDRTYFYINDETDNVNETVIFNVTNLSLPLLAGSYNSGVQATDHNLYVHQGFIFEAEYRAGLRVFDAADPVNPVQIAWFDSYPGSDDAGYNGAWNVYPFFPSGTVIISDIEGGLFVVRVGPPLLVFGYPDGQPDLINPGGDSIAVTITEQAGMLAPSTAQLHYNTGGGFVSADLVAVKGNLYNAVFPALACGTKVDYYLSAQTTNGITVYSPQGAPEFSFLTTSATSTEIGFEDTMETDTGWLVGAIGDTATTGIWTRVDPNGTAAQPEDDNTLDPGVMCWITGQGMPGGADGENDVDGGATTLTSPTLDATGGENAYISYARWYSNNAGAAPNEDSMPVSISNDNGSSWTQLELVTENAGAWVLTSFRIADFVAPTNQMRLRFVASDLGSGSLVEAGVDDVRITYYGCTLPCPADVAPVKTGGDGVVNVSDLLLVIAEWGNAGGPADITGDGIVNVSDLLAVIAAWGPCQ